MASQVIGVGLRLATTIILSRLLPPSSFGLIAMVTFFRGLMEMVSGSGFVESTVQKKNLALDELNGVFWINLIISIFLAGSFIASGPFIADFYGEPEIAAICTVVGLLFVLENLFKTHEALLRRTMNEELSFVILLVPQLVNLPVAVALALLGFDVWALVGASVFSVVAQRLLFLYFVRWDPEGFKSSKDLGTMVRYGLKSMSASIVNYCSLYSQNLALGKFGSVTDVGFYNRGQAVFLMPIQTVSLPIAQLILPMLSVLQNDRKQVLALVLKASWLVVLLVMPFTLFMVVYGDWAISFLLGEIWALSGRVTQWLAISSIPVLVFGLLPRANCAIGRPGQGTPVVLLSLPLLITGIIYGAPLGPVFVASIYAVYRWGLYPFLVVIHLRGSGFVVKDFILSQCSLFIMVLVVLVVMFAMRLLGEDLEGSSRVVYMAMNLTVCYGLFVMSFNFFSTGKQVNSWLASKISGAKVMVRVTRGLKIGNS
jgi:PST family polysaccharide transporter